MVVAAQLRLFVCFPRDYKVIIVIIIMGTVVFPGRTRTNNKCKNEDDTFDDGRTTYS
jgi:hypothetical protein